MPVIARPFHRGVLDQPTQGEHAREQGPSLAERLRLRRAARPERVARPGPPPRQLPGGAADLPGHAARERVVGPAEIEGRDLTVDPVAPIEISLFTPLDPSHAPVGESISRTILFTTGACLRRFPRDRDQGGEGHGSRRDHRRDGRSAVGLRT
jgi:hypothetical protein